MSQRLITLLAACFLAPLSLLAQTWDKDIYLPQSVLQITSCSFSQALGGLLLLNTYDSSSSLCSDVYFSRVNKYGDTVWTKRNMLDTLSMHAYPQMSAQLSDGGYIIALPSVYFGNPETYAGGLFSRIDSNGNVLFMKTTPVERQWGRGLCAAATADNGFYISYTYDSIYHTGGGSRIVVISYLEQYDAGNTCTWRKRWATDYCLSDPFNLYCSDDYYQNYHRDNVYLGNAADGVVYKNRSKVGKLRSDGTTQFETDISGSLPLVDYQDGLFGTSDSGAVAILYDTMEHICKFSASGTLSQYNVTNPRIGISKGCELSNGKYLMPMMRDSLGTYMAAHGFYIFESDMALVDSVLSPFRDSFYMPGIVANPMGGAYAAFITNVGGIIHVMEVNFDSLYNIHRHLKVSLFSNCLVPGDTSKLTTSLHNYGNRIVDTLIRVIKDPSTYYISSSVAPFGISGDTITYRIDSLQPDSSRNIITRVLVDSTLAIGEMLTFHAWSPYPNNISIHDDSAIYYGTTVGSLDPNYKAVNKTYYCTPENREFVYVIGFENTGNYYARNIKVEDTIDQHFDISTLCVLSGDPQVPQVEVSAGNRVRFVFTDINLPDSNTNPGNHHGDFAYSVKLKDNAVIGDVLKNTAYIYFDFNPAVVTNTTTNILSNKNASLYSSFPNGHVKLLPNPSSGSFTVVLPEPNTKYSIVITDISGRVFSSGLFNTNVINYHLDLSNGVYMVAAYNYRTHNRYSEKLVIHK